MMMMKEEEKLCFFSMNCRGMKIKRERGRNVQIKLKAKKAE